MNPSCHFSSTKHTPSLPQQSFHYANYHPFISKNNSPFFSSRTHIPNIQTPEISNPSFTTLRINIKHSRLWHPFATLAEAGGEEDQNEGIQLSENQHQQQHYAAKSKTQKGGDGDNELPGIAKAFNISPKSASAISICMALAALTFPFFMASMGQALTLKTKLLSYATLLFGLYMAWNIGANDVANAMGTSVGSGALTLRQAVLTAAVLEFSGALLMGSHVTSTMQKGLLVSEAFQGKDTLLFAGLLSSLAAAGTWLQVNY